MAKKRFISSFLLCAFAILFAHSIIPHHHHEEAGTEQHNSRHDDDHDGIDNNFLGHAFSYFEHEREGSIIYETASPSFTNLFQFSIFLLRFYHSKDLMVHRVSFVQEFPYNRLMFF